MANLGKVIYINETDYSTLLNGGSITKGGTTYTYDSTALYVIKDVSAPEYAETAGYATTAGQATTASQDGSGNDIATTYSKKPLVIEVDDTDTSVPQGTYNSITAALAAGKDVIVKSTTSGITVNYYRLTFELTSDDEYYFRSDNSGLAITSSDTLSRFASAVNPHFHGNIQSNGTLQTTDITIANGDKLVVTDASNSNRISRASLTFDGSTTTQALSKKGTWETFKEKTLLYMTVSGTTPSFTDANNNSLTHAQVITLLQDSTKEVEVFYDDLLYSQNNFTDHVWSFHNISPEEALLRGFDLRSDSNTLSVDIFQNSQTVTTSTITKWNNKVSDVKVKVGTGTATSIVDSNKVANVTLDTTPTANSTNTVTSGGIKTALDAKVAKVTSTDNAIARFDGTGGQIQNSGVTINDSNHVTAAKFITSGGTSNKFLKGDGSLDGGYYIKNGDYIINTRAALENNVKLRIYDRELQDCFWAANIRFVATHKVYNNSDDSFVKDISTDLFKGSYESWGNTVTVDQYAILYLGYIAEEDLLDNASTTNSMSVYPSGKIILQFYTSKRPGEILEAKGFFRNDTDWRDLTVTTNNSVTYFISVPNVSYLKAIRIKYSGSNLGSEGVTSLTDVSFIRQRDDIASRDIVTKYPVAQNLYGDVTAPKFITRGGTSSQFVKGNGSLDSTTYTPQTAAGANALLTALPDWTAVPTDTTKLVRRDTSGGAAFGQITFLTVWNYINSKAATVYAPSADVVHLANEETITGVKTFDNGFKLKEVTSPSNNDRCVPFSAAVDKTNIQFVYTDSSKGLTYNPNTGAVKAGSFVTRGGTSSQFVKGDGSLDSVVIPQNLHVKLTSATSGGTTTYSANYTYEQILTSINNGGTPDLEYDAYIYRFDSVVDTLIMFSKIDGTQVGEDNQDKLLEHTFCVESNNTWTKETREIITTASSSNFGLVKLTSSFRSTDDTLAATAHAVKRAYDHGGVQSVNGQTGAVTGLAPLASPALTGTPTAPTAASGTNTTQIATTAFVQNALSNMGAGGSEMVDVTITGTISSASFSANPYNAIKAVVDDGKIAVLNANVTPLSTTDVLIPVYEYTYSQSGTDFTGYKGKIQNGNYEISVDVQSTSSATVSITSVGSSITVDTALSESSTNPVQNRVITAQILENEEIVATALNNLNDRVELKQDQLVSGTTIKTINNQSILGSGNINISGGGGGGGEENVIEVVKVNGTALTPDANKAVNIPLDSTPTANSGNAVTSGGIKTALDGKATIATFNVTSTTSGGVTTYDWGTTKFSDITNAINNCDDVIIDYDGGAKFHHALTLSDGGTIHSFGQSGGLFGPMISYLLLGEGDNDSIETTLTGRGVANADWNENSSSSDAYIKNKPNLSAVATTGSYWDLIDRPTIPTALSNLTDDSTHRLVTDTEKSTWNGKYSKPSGGIPKTDLASAVQTSLGKADTALQPDVDNDLEQGTISSSNSQGFDYIIANKDTSSEQTLQDALDAKASISAVNAKYTKPAAGIPDTDLTTAVNVRLLAQLSSGSDDGKIMKYSYSGGGWQAVKPVTIYSGSSAPSSSTGSNGDIYIQTS